LPDDLTQGRIGNTLRKPTRIGRYQTWGHTAASDNILFNRFEILDNLHILQRFSACRIICGAIALRPVHNHLAGELTLAL